MRKTTTTVIVMTMLLLSANRLSAQGKTGCISFNELLASMPEVKQSDTALAQYQGALQQQFEDYKAEYSDQFKLLSSPDTAKYSKAQLEVKRKALSDIYVKLQGYNEEASQLIDQKRQALLAPIQKKAADAIQAVAKENGYGFIVEKDALHAYPPSEDILPLVKKKLGLR